jgi:hypothetical protein
MVIGEHYENATFGLRLNARNFAFARCRSFFAGPASRHGSVTQEILQALLNPSNATRRTRMVSPSLEHRRITTVNSWLPPLHAPGQSPSTGPDDILEISLENEINTEMLHATSRAGTLAIKAVHLMHHSLDWSSETLHRLAIDLFQANGAPRRYSKSEVRAFVAKLRVEDVEGDGAKAFVEQMRAKHGQ